MTVLLLRGAQAPGELKTPHRAAARLRRPRRRSRRCLQRMAALRRRRWSASSSAAPGQHDGRWVHLLGPVRVETAASRRPAPAVDRESVLADGRGGQGRQGAGGVRRAWRRRTPSTSPTSWTGKPFDRWLLDAGGRAGGGPARWSTSAPARGTSRRTSPPPGADVTGRRPVARRWSSEARRRLPRPGASRSATSTGLLRPAGRRRAGAPITAWYALVHLAGSELAPDSRVAGPGARARRLAGAGPARRRRGAPRRRAVRGRRSTSTSCCTTPTTSWPRCGRPGWSTSSGTCAAPTTAPRSRPTGSTSWRAVRVPPPDRQYLRLTGETSPVKRRFHRPAGETGRPLRSSAASPAGVRRRRNPRRSFTAFIGALTPATGGEDVAAVRGIGRAPPVGWPALRGEPQPVAAMARDHQRAPPARRATTRPVDEQLGPGHALAVGGVREDSELVAPGRHEAVVTAVRPARATTPPLELQTRPAVPRR